jgi:DNA-dependent RNA polymerase auxiliary subunit epsilon
MLYHDSQLRTIRLNDYNTLFYFEIESQVDFRPLVSKNHRLYHITHVDCVLSEHIGWSAFS